MKTCAQCHGPITRLGHGPQPKYCSEACRCRANYERARADGRSVEWREKAKSKRQAERAAKAKPCPYCGTLMTNPRRAQCGADECQRQHKAARMRDWFRKYKEKTGQRYNANFESQRSKPKYLKTCEHCLTKWISWNPEARYCSQGCWGRAQRAPRAQVVLRTPRPWWARRPLPVPLRPLRRRWYAGKCAACETWFVHDQPATRTCSPTCSKRVSRRASKDRRRALERQAFVAPVNRRAIFERDHWTCQLCGGRVHRSAQVPHPKAPVLDHIIPLADHGTHEPANVQCAHFLCNSIKGDRGGGEQLLLIG